MNRFRRRLAALFIAAAVASASLSGSLAIPAESPFADFRIDASGMDVTEYELSVDIYRRGEDGQFSKEDTRQYPCNLNRVTADAGFFIQTNNTEVWVTVDYLTDVNGDGVYELLEDSDCPTWDVMDVQGTLTQPQDGTVSVLTPGRLYILSPDALVYGSQQAVQARTAEGVDTLDVGHGPVARQESPLCMVQLHRTDPADGQNYEQTYYLQIYGNVLIPFDVSPSDWYYDAVEFVLERGYFVGGSDGLFHPEDHLTRAELTQVLWTMEGSQPGADSYFVDVPYKAWFYPAVSWCQQQGLITGYTADTFAPSHPLSREQMLTVLHRYAQYAGSNLYGNADLSVFSDHAEISAWAVDSVRWAVTNGLISSSDGTLGPHDIVSRAELADLLYAYDRNLGLGD